MNRKMAIPAMNTIGQRARATVLTQHDQHVYSQAVVTTAIKGVGRVSTGEDQARQKSVRQGPE